MWCQLYFVSISAKINWSNCIFEKLLSAVFAKMLAYYHSRVHNAVSTGSEWNFVRIGLVPKSLLSFQYNHTTGSLSWQLRLRKMTIMFRGRNARAYAVVHPERLQVGHSPWARHVLSRPVVVLYQRHDLLRSPQGIGIMKFFQLNSFPWWNEMHLKGDLWSRHFNSVSRKKGHKI